MAPEGRKKKRTVSVLTCLSVIVLKSHSLEQAVAFDQTAKGSSQRRTGFFHNERQERIFV